MKTSAAIREYLIEIEVRKIYPEDHSRVSE